MFNLPQELLMQVYAAIIQNVLFTSIIVSFGSKQDNRQRQTVRTAEEITGANLPFIQDSYISRVKHRQETSLQTHPEHTLFQLFSSSGRYGTLYNSEKQKFQARNRIRLQ